MVPSLPPLTEHNIPLRDKMLKQPDGKDGSSRKRDNFVSIYSVSCVHMEYYYADKIFIALYDISSLFFM